MSELFAALGSRVVDETVAVAVSGLRRGRTAIVTRLLLPAATAPRTHVTTWARFEQLAPLIHTIRPPRIRVATLTPAAAAGPALNTLTV